LEQNSLVQHVRDQVFSDLSILSKCPPYSRIIKATGGTTFLSDERHDLLCGHWIGIWRRMQWFDVTTAPEANERSRSDQILSMRGEKQAIPSVTGSAACSTKALQKGRDSSWGFKLQYVIEISNIDPEFQGAGGNNHAVARIPESSFRLASFVNTKRTVTHKSVRTRGAQQGRQAFSLGAAIRENKALLPPMQLGNHESGVFNATYVIEHDIGVGEAGGRR
jgi:hypothetical protein